MSEGGGAEPAPAPAPGHAGVGRALAWGVGLAALLVLAFGALPPWVFDLLLAAHLGASAWLLARALDARDAAAFAPLPAWLLWGVLGRLALNVASTRLILTGGDAGALVQAFSGPLIGGSVAAGAGALCALLAAQVVVITRGGERMAEVAARFSLDALPGQQLALDADQRGGALTAAQAQAARARLLAESKLFGALDGTLKLVRGDAWVGVVILLIDLLGGVAVATLEGGLSGGDALRAFSALAVGDGLALLPSGLLLSLCAGLVALRMSTPQPLHADSPPAAHPTRPLWVAAGALGALALLPAVPAWPLLTAAAGAVACAFAMRRAAAAPPSHQDATATAQATATPPASDAGPALPPAVSVAWSGDPAQEVLRQRIDALWVALGQREGLRLPPITWASTPSLNDRAVVRLDGMRFLEADLGHLAAREGEPLRPLLPHALSLQMVQDLLDRWRAREPQLVAAATAHALPLPRLTALLRRLLLDGVPLQPMRPLLEASLTCPPSAPLDALYAAARAALGASLAEKIRATSGVVLLIGPQICDALTRALRPAPSDHLPPRLALAPDATQEILNALDRTLDDHALDKVYGEWVCVVSSAGARAPMQLLLRAQGVFCPVIALDEVAPFDIAPHDRAAPLLSGAVTIDLGDADTPRRDPPR